MENYFDGGTQLNERQFEAVTSTEGFVRVIAGAGSGKTRALTHRFVFLVNELGILPENILCVTFTNKAANEMRSRLHSLLGDRDTGLVNTFHGFCVTVLQEDIYAVQYPDNFLVLDNSDIDSILRIIYEERNLTLRDMTFSDARDMIEIQKLFRKPEYYLDMIDMSLEALYAKYEAANTRDDIIFYGYLYHEKKCFGLDYNDLIKFTLYIFKNRGEIRLKWQERLEYIMIDEFQDIDDLQYELMDVLCDYHKNLFIVGDPDQTIYTWRGANVKYLLDFDRSHPGTKTVMMLANYRSTPQIIAAANSLIDRNRHRIKKDLEAMLPDGGPVRFSFAGNSEDEAMRIAREAEALHGDGIPYRDMTILYRAHYVTRAVEEAFLKEKLPYRIYSGVPFFGRAEIKDALSYLRMAVLQDDLSFRRVVNLPKRNMGIRRMEFLEKASAETGHTLYRTLKEHLDDPVFKGTKARAFTELIDRFSAEAAKESVLRLLSGLLDQSGYEEMLRTEGSQERLDNLAELKQSIHDYEITCGEETGPEHYLKHIALFTDSDIEDSADRVKMMTVHAAKGLEFPYVFLCGMNEGIFPSGKVKNLPGMEEERRLAFVALTRAEKGLFISGAAGRNFDGSPRYPSRFVMGIDEDLIEYDPPLDEGLVRAARIYAEGEERLLPENIEADLLAAGTRVRHRILGEGEILKIDKGKGAYLIQFDGMSTPRAISFRMELEKL